MPSIRNHMKSLPAPAGMKVLWIRNVPADITYARLSGAEIYTLTPEEIKDAKKREAKIGKWYVGPDGLLTFGDVVAMIISEKDFKALNDDNALRANSRIGRLAEGGDLKDASDGHQNALAAVRLRMTRSSTEPFSVTDTAPADFAPTKPPTP